MRQMHVELHAFDRGLVLAGDMQMVAIQFEFAQRARELVGIHAEIKERADEHVAADAAEEVEIESFHGSFWEPWMMRRIITMFCS